MEKQENLDRKGVFTAEQEKTLDKLYNSKGLLGKVDGLVIKTVDNIVIEKLKAKIPEQYLPVLYNIIDEIMESIKDSVEDKE